MNTKHTHKQRHYENGKTNPFILVESEEDGEFIEYASGHITKCIYSYNGEIPSGDSNLEVWHHESSTEKAENMVIREYESIHTKTSYVSGEVGVEERILEFSNLESRTRGDKWDRARKNFFLDDLEEINKYCSTLLTCNCGHRCTYDSVSESLGHKISHSLDGHSPHIWYYCGQIDNKTKRESYIQYESSESVIKRISRLFNLSQERTPIMSVPIHMTPFSIALSRVGGYGTKSYSHIES